jgi:phosphatidylethanolamine/phosphatidyl-N-methylethanolamine N-methyltransferase
MVTMAKLLAKEDGIFFARWLRDPLRLASVTPSGAALAKLMARQIDPARPDPVLELGAGTGALTTAILARGVLPERLVIIERDKVFHRMLQRRFPESLVLREDAAEMTAPLAAAGIERIASVVSGLPLLAMSRTQQQSVLTQAFSILAPDGVFVQFTYGPDSPIPRRRLAEWGLRCEFAGRAWLNLPPATVWRFKRINDA